MHDKTLMITVIILSITDDVHAAGPGTCIGFLSASPITRLSGGYWFIVIYKLG